MRFILRATTAPSITSFCLASAEEQPEARRSRCGKIGIWRIGEANGRQIKPAKTDEIVWRFTNAGEFEFARLIPAASRGRDAPGKVVVK